MSKAIKLSQNDLDRFWSKVNKQGALWTNPQTGETSHCWEWQASTVKGGYGRFRIGFRLFLAHRVAYEIANGIPLGELDALHRCDNPRCCNPAHLFKGDDFANMQDMFSKGRGNRATGERSGQHTHPEKTARGERSGMAKLTYADVMEIRRLSREGLNGQQIADRFGMSKGNINKILRNELWKEPIEHE